MHICTTQLSFPPFLSAFFIGVLTAGNQVWISVSPVVVVLVRLLTRFSGALPWPLKFFLSQSLADWTSRGAETAATGNPRWRRGELSSPVAAASLGLIPLLWLLRRLLCWLAATFLGCGRIHNSPCCQDSFLLCSALLFNLLSQMWT